MAEIMMLDNFLKVRLRKELLRRYRRFEILSEGDMQVLVCNKVRNFLRRNSKQPDLYEVRNQPFIKEIGAFPDVVVKKKGKPWVCIELKEKHFFHNSYVQADCGVLRDANDKAGARRGYLIYIARNGKHNVTSKAAALHGRRVAFIPIALEAELSADKFKKWEQQYKERATAVPKKAAAGVMG